MAIKAVFFDLDDTLYGDFPACDRAGFAAQGVYAQTHLGIDSETFVQALRESKRQLQERLYGEPEPRPRALHKGALELLGLNPMRHAEALHHVYWDTVFAEMRLREGVHELLDALRARGIQVGICTNMLADIQMRKLVALDLDARVDFLVTSEEAGADKPASPLFELALARAGCRPEEALMVGDSFGPDMEGAHGVGIDGVWLKLRPDDRLAQPWYQAAATFPEAAQRVLLAVIAERSNS